MTHVAERLSEIGALRPGWLNGDGAAIPEPALRRAERLCKRLAAWPRYRHPYLYPGVDGVVRLEFDEHRGWTTVVDVHPDRAVFLAWVAEEIAVYELTDEPFPFSFASLMHAIETGGPMPLDVPTE